MDEDVKLEKIGVRKPTYEELESEYGRMADRCEYAEKLNKSLERVIVEKDNTIESLTREIEDYARIGREKQNIIHSLTDENKELKVELEKTKKEQNDIMQDCKFKLNSVFGVNGTGINYDYITNCNAYKDDVIKPNGMNVTEVIVARLKDTKEIVDVSDHKVWEIVYVKDDDICAQHITYKNKARLNNPMFGTTIEKTMFHVSNYGKTWMFVDDLGNQVEANTDGEVKEIKSDDNGNS